MSAKFRVAESPVYDGKWAVVENSTDCPAIVEGTPLDCLTVQEARDLVDLMNNRDIRAHEP
ncbi:hypothetical protein RGCCGE502_22630 [Rhizobium grahamii CCGE 502]|uniref:Uncharacterized protein n=1 Tax=Rhizobium grahamii CCGE 502 TaxID=990285 RepID=S3HAT2_9HYPH|nr:hypothetical protein RGCCGE502_22630 [Rhizobium grahamii CCGE 502]